MIKFKWKVAQAPTGPYRSFHRRSWPHAEDLTGRMLVRIECLRDGQPHGMSPAGGLATSYTPDLSRADVLPDRLSLKVYLADYSAVPSFKWQRLKGDFTSLKDAKAAAINALAKHEEFWPK